MILPCNVSLPHIFKLMKAHSNKRQKKNNKNNYVQLQMLPTVTAESKMTYSNNVKKSISSAVDTLFQYVNRASETNNMDVYLLHTDLKETLWDAVM